MTGGKAYFPRFEGEMPEIFRDINSAIRNQYVVSYRPTNAKEDGTYRKIRGGAGGQRRQAAADAG